MNLIEILKGVPKGTKLYSPVLGDVVFRGILNESEHPIKVTYFYSMDKEEMTECGFCSDGRYFDNIPSTECMLFPSKEQRDWSKFYLPGEILATEHGNIFIFKKYQEGDFDRVKAYCGINAMGTFIISDESSDRLSWTTSVVRRATDWEIEILLEKMRESGYEWDEPSKSLKPYKKDLPKNTPVVVFNTLFYEDTDIWAKIRIYAGNGRCYCQEDSSDTFSAKYIVPFDKLKIENKSFVFNKEDNYGTN